MYKATERQTGISMFVTILSLKLLIYPALVARFAGNNAYLSVILSLLIDFVFVVILLSVMKKNPNMTIKEILDKGVGKVISKIIFIIMFVYFTAKCILTLKECHNFFFLLLYDQLEWFYFFIPILTLAWFVMRKGLKAFSRTMELLFLLVLLGTIISIFVPINMVDFDNFLPILENGVSPILNATITTNFAFGDYFILILFAGNIKFENKPTRKIYGYVFLAYAIVVLFHVLFIGFFGDASVIQSLAVSDIPLQAQIPLNNGRLEWLNICIWTITQILQVLLLMLCAKTCFDSVFKFKNENIAIAVIEIIILICVYILYFSLAQGIRIMISPYFYYTSVAIQVVVPLIIWISSCILNGKNKKNSISNLKEVSCEKTMG